MWFANPTWSHLCLQLRAGHRLAAAGYSKATSTQSAWSDTDAAMYAHACSTGLCVHVQLYTRQVT